MSNVRVRFAPSPTGELHIGGARTALFNWLFARKEQGAFVLRIDDTDIERSTKESLAGIFDSLKWLGLDWDEGPEKNETFGPYFQSQRSKLYQEEAERLLQEGKAYNCYCTTEELAAAREKAREAGRDPLYNGRCRELNDEQQQKMREEGRKPVIRLRTPLEGTTEVEDRIRGRVSFENNTFDDFILLKSNRWPTYNFASVVDDYHMKISHVIRAEEHLSNTPKQILIARALKYDLPVFAHVPMILAPDRSKLSKRHGATSVDEFREQGYLPEALVNYLALLGWSPPGEQEVLPLEEIVANFSLDRVSKTAAIYDVKKLSWINGQYLRDSDPKRIVSLALPYLQEAGFVSKEPSEEEYTRAQKIIAAIQDRIKKLSEVADAVSYFYTNDFAYEEKGVRKHFQKEGVKDVLSKARERLSQVDEWNQENTESAYRELSQELEISAARIIHPTRLAISGRTGGPGLFDIMVLLGKEKTLARLDRAIDFLENIN